ncbi:MAG: glycoside hydrolase family 3 N-terminal domain-containing protein [Cytophagales bacterium]
MQKILFLLALVSSGSLAQKTNSKFPKQTFDKTKIEEYISKMTLEEKVGQMAQITLDVVCKGNSRFQSAEPIEIDTAKLRHALVKYKIGSVLNTANNKGLPKELWFKVVSQIQAMSMKANRLSIPCVYGIDAIHGTTYTLGSTMFPQQITQAASRNRDLVKKAAEITAYETRASSIPWNFSPVLDLGADPRFPRQWETFGEDPYLATELGKAAIKGYEGDSNMVSSQYRVASCLKHFLGYSTPFSGKDRTTAYLSDQMLREYHLPAFRAAIEAGSHSIMVNSGLINGIPVHSSYYILTKLLREELNFKGVVVTDWADIENLFKRDQIVASDKDAIMLAINAGIDMSMIPYNYEVFCDNLVALVNEGKVKQSRIDQAVFRVLKFKSDLGLFELPVTNFKNYAKFGSKEFADASYQTAAEAITLLKNKDNILPLAKNTNIFVTGPNANSMRTLNGGWTYSWQGEKAEQFTTQFNTILEAIQNKAGSSFVTYSSGVSYKMNGNYNEEFEEKQTEALDNAAKADVIVVCVGENSYTEKPGDLNDLTLSTLQTDYVLKLESLGKPIVLVLNEGRPRLISRIEPKANAVIQTYLPGNFGGDALAAILFGEVNPSGKLPYTYAMFPNATSSYIHKYSEETKKPEGMYNYEADYNQQYEFGFGLSYTTFTYADLKLDKTKLNESETLIISVKVTNSGAKEGKEVVQLYISDIVASIAPDVKRLRGFQKINLKAGESKVVEFTISPKDIAVINADSQSVTEEGEFKVAIANLAKNFSYFVNK